MAVQQLLLISVAYPACGALNEARVGVRVSQRTRRIARFRSSEAVEAVASGERKRVGKVEEAIARAPGLPSRMSCKGRRTARHSLPRVAGIWHQICGYVGGV